MPTSNQIRAKLTIWEMASGIVIMVLSQVLGTLPAQDWLTYGQIKASCFVIGTVVTVFKGMEMFFSKTSSLIEQGKLSGLEEATTKPQIIVTAQIVPGVVTPTEEK